MITEILPRVYIGDEQDANSLTLIKRYEITALLDLRNLHIDEKLDDEGILQIKRAASELSRLIGKGHTVLVHCHAGMDRAPFLVAYYLYKYKLELFRQAYDFVKEKRPQTLQHWEWVSEFC